MTRTEVLQNLLELGGVEGAAFVSRSGELLESLPGRAHDLAPDLIHIHNLTYDLVSVQAGLTGFLASSRVLAELLGAEAATQTTLELGGGAVLLTTLVTIPADPPDAPLGVVVLTTAEGLGRVRFGLRRLLPQLAAEPPERRR